MATYKRQEAVLDSDGEPGRVYERVMLDEGGTEMSDGELILKKNHQKSNVERRARYFERGRSGALLEVVGTDDSKVAVLLQRVAQQDEVISAMAETVRELVDREPVKIIKEVVSIPSVGAKQQPDQRVDSLLKEVEYLKESLKKTKLKDSPELIESLDKLRDDLKELAKVVRVGFENLEVENGKIDERLVDVENTIIKFGVVAETISEARASNADEHNDSERKGPG